MTEGRTPLSLVREFHQVYGLPDRIDERRPTLNIGERLQLRMDLIAEEFFELVEAVYGGKQSERLAAGWEQLKEIEQGFAPKTLTDDETVEAADAQADLVYVVFGMAIECGIDLDAVLKEVQRSNLSKLGEDGKPIYREDGKVLKGPNFFKPNIAKVLGLE